MAVVDDAVIHIATIGLSINVASLNQRSVSSPSMVFANMSIYHAFDPFISLSCPRQCQCIVFNYWSGQAITAQLFLTDKTPVDLCDHLSKSNMGKSLDSFMANSDFYHQGNNQVVPKHNGVVLESFWKHFLMAPSIMEVIFGKSICVLCFEKLEVKSSCRHCVGDVSLLFMQRSM
jgi:hypothetical protein